MTQRQQGGCAQLHLRDRIGAAGSQTREGLMTSAVSTCLWYDSDAEAAARFYVALFPGAASVTSVLPSFGGDGGAFLVEFDLLGQHYTVMNCGPMHRLSEAVSISVLVDDQAELDRLWSALTAGGGTEGRCGWLKDRWGLSWQIVPRYLVSAIRVGGPSSGRVIQAMMGMGRIDIAALESAARG
jgi:predicted 3-demethylubiquinone-9 3-methyltransferase (glyoxalase superfamily)